MAIFEINSTNTDVDIQRLKIEIESAVNIVPARVLNIEPSATGVKVIIDADVTTSQSQLDALKTSVIDAHDSSQRKRVLVYDLPDATGSASNKDYVDSKSSDTLDAAKQYTDEEIAKLVNSAPAVLDTLGELSDALGDDPNFATTISGQIGTINTEIDSLSDRIDGLETDTGTIGTDLTALTNRVTAAETDINTVEGLLPLKADISSLADVALSGSYTDLIDTPLFAPVALSGSYTDLIDTPLFAPVALSGSYTDLVDTPTLFSGSYNDLTDRPVFAAVATTGSYNDLVDTPEFAAALDDLTDVTVGSATKGQILVNNGTVFTNTNTIESFGPSSTPLTLKAATSQTANVFNIQNSSGTPIFEISNFGRITASTDRTSLIVVGASGITNNDLFQVRDSTSNVLLAVRHHSTDTSQRWVSMATKLGVGSNDRPSSTVNIHSTGNTTLQLSQGAESPSYENGFRLFYNGIDIIQKICPLAGRIIFISGGANLQRVIIDSTGLLTANNGTVLNSGAAATKALVVKGAASQTANLIEAQDNSGLVVASIDASGNITSPTITQLQNQIAAGAGSPTGAVISFAGANAPTGWLLCNGGAVNTYTYRFLHAVISNIYGGTAYNAGVTDIPSATTTFNVPDLRGRGVSGLDNMGGADAGRLSWSNTLGTAAGSETHTLITSEMPSHTHIQNAHNHPITDPAHSHGQTVNANPGLGNGAAGSQSGIRLDYNGDVPFGQWAIAYDSGNWTYASATYITVNNQTATNQNTGGGLAHNNMQPTMLLNYIIKT